MSDSPFKIIITPESSPPRTYGFDIEKDGALVDAGYTFLWNFGDGQTSKEASPVYTYDDPGNYEVSCELKVMKDKDRTDKSGSNPPPDPPPEGVTASVIVE